MIQKQIVYLPIEGKSIDELMECKEGYFLTPEELNEYTANIIKKVLETADEKAEKTWCSDGYSTGMWEGVIDKQLITNTFEEIFKRFEV